MILYASISLGDMNAELRTDHIMNVISTKKKRKIIFFSNIISLFLSLSSNIWIYNISFNIVIMYPFHIISHFRECPQRRVFIIIHARRKLKIPDPCDCQSVNKFPVSSCPLSTQNVLFHWCGWRDAENDSVQGFYMHKINRSSLFLIRWS